jgi:S-adenosylmethionine:tRNA ribosyltransferase-isomerase
MQVEQFDYDLPANLIASWPARERTDCRMLVLDGASGRVAHRQFNDIIELIAPGDLLVLNDTKVIPARLIGQKTTGGKVEVLVERVLSANRILAHIRASKSLRPGVSLVFEENYTAQVIERRGELYELAFTGRDSVMDILDKVGHVPLPPYIKRADADFDKERYQTVYARVPGAVAAPTAGLHFDQALLARLRQHRVNFAFVTYWCRHLPTRAGQ